MRIFTARELALIDELFHLARVVDVCCELSVGGGTGEWTVTIASAAPAENFNGQDHHTPEYSLEPAVKWLRKLAHGDAPAH